MTDTMSDKAQAIAALERRIAYDAARHDIEINCEEIGRAPDGRPWFDIGSCNSGFRLYVKRAAELLDLRGLLRRSDTEPAYIVQILDDPEGGDAIG